MCLVCVMLLLIGDDLLQVGKKIHDMKKSTYKMKKPLQAPESTALRLLYGLAVVFLKY